MNHKSNVLRNRNTTYHFFVTVTLFLGVVFCSSCAREPVSETTVVAQDHVMRGTITSTPSDAYVAVNGQSIGTTPVSYNFNFTNQSEYSVLVEKEEYLPETIMVNAGDLDSSNGVISVSLSLHPLIEFTTDSFSANHWENFVMRPELMEKRAWDALVRIVKKRSYKISKINETNGSLITIFRKKVFQVDGSIVYLRSRIETRFTMEYPQLLMGFFLRTEKSYDGHKWVPYCRVAKMDQQTVSLIRKEFAVQP